MSKYTILIAEDNEAALHLLKKSFILEGFVVYPVETCSKALKLIKERKPDCLLLDYCLKDGTALDVCKKVRVENAVRKTPIVILSGQSQKSLSSYTVCQADFFVEKGKSCKEVVAVVKSLLRRLEWERGIVKKEDITLDAHTSSVLTAPNRIIRLTSKQFRFFSMIFKKRPDFVDEEIMVKHVFGSNFSNDKIDALYTLCYRLRQKLGPRLACRVKRKKSKGWIYVQPRLR